MSLMLYNNIDLNTLKEKVLKIRVNCVWKAKNPL